MNNVANYLREQFDGMLIVGDVHGDYASFMRAYEYAKSENFLFMSLGDLTDRDRYPFEVVKKMHELMYDGRAAFTIGNHDDKFRRYYYGSKVRFSFDARQTLEDVGVEREAEFLKMYTEIIEDKMLSGLYHKFDDFILVHGAFHPGMCDEKNTESESLRSRALYGETTGELYPDGYPVRAYTWIGEIPMGKTVIVGHDKQPIHNVPITEPMVVSNPNGGKAIFMDTGCGKGGFLTGAVMMNTKKGFVLEGYKEFR